MLGFSVYLSHDLTADDYNYLIAMRNAGFNTVFTSLLEYNNGEVKRLNELGKWCKNLDLKVIADVSKESLEFLGIKQLADLEKFPLTGIRADEGISMPDIAKISKAFTVVLNASTITQNDIDELKDENADFDNLTAWHNFYPHPNTGLASKWFKERNHWLHKFDLKVGAFISGDKSAGFYRPTLEKLRGVNPLAAMLELKKLNCDDVLVGDASINADVIAIFVNYLKEKKITLHLRKGNLTLIQNQWHNRPDVARDVVRLVEGRIKQLFDLTPQEEILSRPEGSVTCDNDLYSRYQGELQITKCDLPADERVNIIDYVVQEDLSLLKFVGSSSPVIFVKSTK